jgi:hypothetical protein
MYDTYYRLYLQAVATSLIVLDELELSIKRSHGLRISLPTARPNDSTDSDPSSGINIEHSSIGRTKKMESGSSTPKTRYERPQPSAVAQSLHCPLFAFVRFSKA